MGLVKKKSKVRVKYISDIIKTNIFFLGYYKFDVKPYFMVDYEYYNQPKQVNTFMPPSKKKADKIYGREVLKTKVVNAKYTLGENRLIKYNGQTYDLSKEVEFNRLHHNLETEYALGNL